MILNSGSGIQSPQPTNCSTAYARSVIHFHLLWSVRMVNLCFSKYGRNCRKDGASSKHFTCFVSEFGFAWMSTFDKKLSGLIVQSGCSWVKVRTTCVSQASISRFKCPLLRRKAGAGTDTSLSWNVARVSCLSFGNFSIVLRLSVLSLQLRGEAILATFSTNCWYTFRKLRDYSSSFTSNCGPTSRLFVGSMVSQFQFPGPYHMPNKVNFLGEELALLKFSCTDSCFTEKVQ